MDVRKGMSIMEHYSSIHAIVAYIESHIHEAVNSTHLAALVGYSEPYLRELFLKYRGITLSHYLMLRRISHAAFDALQTDRTLTDVALDYGFDSYDSFTRAFRRVTGYTPSAFRKERPSMERRMLGIGVFGIAQADKTHAGKFFMIDEAAADVSHHSTVLYGIPKIHYGAYGGVTPYPICLKACASYLGTDADYADILAGCGAAFRLTWNTLEWDGGNVDVLFSFDGDVRQAMVYENGLKALGHEYRLLTRAENRTKEDIKVFLCAALDEGMPVIAMGMVGPPEAGIVAGYREDGDVLLGWSVFQDYPDYNAGIRFDKCGYYITDHWWENGVDTLVAVGSKVHQGTTPNEVARLALQVLRPRMEGPYAKGILAYDAWRAALEREDFPSVDASARRENILPRLAMPLMCQCDAVDCIMDGRNSAAKYFRQHAAEHPLYAEAAAHFEAVCQAGMEMYRAMGGWERGEKQMLALAAPEIRRHICKLVTRAKTEDEAAYDCLVRQLNL